MKRAVWRGTVNERGVRYGTWHCYHDDQVLVVEDSAMAVAQGDLVPLPHSVEGLEAWGLPVRTRTFGKSARGGKTSMANVVLPPLYTYCPRPGCGRGQRIG